MVGIQSAAAEIRRGKKKELEMWANAQRGGRPTEYRWRPLFNAAVWLTPTTAVPCSNADRTRVTILGINNVVSVDAALGLSLHVSLT